MPSSEQTAARTPGATQAKDATLATKNAASTVTPMPATKRSPVVARFVIVSNDHAAGEAYRHAVTVEKSGRVRSVVNCAEREEHVQEWSGAQPPTLSELADLLVVACRDEHHESRLRLLSAVVHGLLPQGNHLWAEGSGVPDAVLDASLGFGARTTYQAEIQRALVDSLRGNPGVAWARQIEIVGTDEHAEFRKQIDEASTRDPEWVRRATETSRSGLGTSFDDLVSWVVNGDEPGTTMAIYWDSLYGGDFSLIPEGWVEENIDPLRRAAAATTWGELKALSKPYWLERLLESHVEDRTDDGVEITDATPFRAVDLGMDTSDLLDHMVAPWDLESLCEWFPDEDMNIIKTHCRTGGASPGGHIDVYAPRDEEALVAALRARGHNVVQRDFLSDLEQALNGLSRQAPALPSDDAASAVFEQTGDTVVVHVDGDEVEWGDYVDDIPAEALVLGFRNENGWGSGSDEIYVVAPGVVVESRVCDDIREQTLHENVTDVAGLALDRLDNSEMMVALAVSVYGPLFDGNTALPGPLLPMTPWESSPFAEGNDSEEEPSLHWGFCTGATEEVRTEFRRRVDAGCYPLVATLLEVGSPAWRGWVIGLLTAVPLSDQVAADGYPLVKDLGRLKGLSTVDLLETATESLSRR